MTKTKTADKNPVQQIQLPMLAVEYLKSNKPEIDIQNRTVTYIASDETPVLRFDWWTFETFEMVLSHTPQAVDLNRVKNGVCMFTKDHKDTIDSSLGKVISGQVVDGRLELKVKFHTDEEESDKFLKRIENGTDPGTSIGAYVSKLTVVRKAKYEADPDTGRKKMISPALFRADRWELMHYSPVTQPAIPNSKVKKNQVNGELSYSGVMLNQYPMVLCTIEGDPGIDLNVDNLVDNKGDDMVTELNDPKVEELETTIANQKDTIAANEKTIADLQSQLQQSQNMNTELQKSFAALQTQVAELSSNMKRSELSDSYQSLRKLADELLANTQLSKAEYELYFGDDQSKDIEFLLSDAGVARLEVMKQYLNAAKLRQPALNTKRNTDNFIDGNEDNEEFKEVKKAAEAIENAWQLPFRS